MSFSIAFYNNLRTSSIFPLTLLSTMPVAYNFSIINKNSSGSRFRLSEEKIPTHNPVIKSNENRKKNWHDYGTVFCFTLMQLADFSVCEPAGARTQDPILKRDVLYLLSY